MGILNFFKKKPAEKEKPLFTVPGWSATLGQEGEGITVSPEKLRPMVTFDALPPAFAAEGQRNFTQWQNKVANINAGNSLSRHNEYLLGRISYQECASLATDTLISKAVTTIVNEMFKEGGKWEIDWSSPFNEPGTGGSRLIAENQDGFLARFTEQADEVDIAGTVRLACRRALEYGGAFIYIDTTDEDVSAPLFLSPYTLSDKRLKGFRVLEPWQMAPITVNSWDPLSVDYMKPSYWYVMGAGQNVHYSRLIPLSFFDVPELLKPIFNYQGLPLSFFMKSFVASAEVSRQCIADLMLRFRTDYIKTTAQKIADPKTRDRVKFMNLTQNNFGKVLLSQDEELAQVNTPLSGLDSLLSQMYELVTMTTGMPVTKFLGLSPRGFNATGEHDQNNYYDLIAGYENNIACPVLERMGRAVSVLKLFGDYAPKYVFNPLNRLTKTETATLNNLKADYLKKLDELGVITAEDALRAIKEDDFSFSWVEDVPEDAGGFDFGELGGAGENIATGDEFKEDEHPRDKDGKFEPKGGGESYGGKSEQADSEADEQAEAESKIGELDKIDFTREAALPNLTKGVQKRYGLKDKPVLLKRNIIDKNKLTHPDVTEDDARLIIGRSLYKPEAVLKANPDKPAYHNFISRVGNDKNTIVLLELADNKDNYEIVNYHWLKDEARRRKERKADREDAHPI